MQKNRSEAVTLSDWQPIVSGNAELKLSSPAASSPMLRMDFDFKGGGGFVVARRAVTRAMPEEFAVSFRLRGRGPLNNLELKLVDASGQNVWRHVHKDLALPARFRRITIESRDIDFGWGPQGSGQMSSLGSIEIAIVAGAGGAGSVWISDLAIDNRTLTQAPSLTASSELAGGPASGAFAAGWRPQSDDKRPWITIDSIEARSIGGLIIDWLEHAPSGGFHISASSSGKRWKAVYRADAAGGKRSYVYLPGLRTRFLRLQIEGHSSGAVLQLQSFEFSRSLQAFWNNVARGEARGWHPRWLHAEQSLWTPFGRSNGTHCGLMNDDGMVEVDEGSFSLEPMLWLDGRLTTWADVQPIQELVGGWQPVPRVSWQSAQWCLQIQAESTVGGASRVRYRLENRGGAPLIGRLFVLLRPFQVTPPWQSFRSVGGMSPIRDLASQDGTIRVNEGLRVAAPRAQFGALRFDDGLMPAHLAQGLLPDATAVHDGFGFATGALAFDLDLAPEATAEHVVTCAAQPGVVEPPEPAFDWGSRLAVEQWRGNDWALDAVLAALTATCHVLVTRAGAALQPGPRRYTRSWIRDGAMMSAALLRMGHRDEVREFIAWYAPYQRADGFVPCCVDREGVDWLVEHDSHGELLALIADYFRFTDDLDFVRAQWTVIERAVGYIERSLGADGLMPVSVSHEGYLAQPVHSYWDGFWTLRGVQDAAQLASALGNAERSGRWAALGARLADSLYASIATTRQQRKLDFIPGSIEWADFDPTATANAIYLFDVPEALDRAAIDRTFDKYLADWREKRSGALRWTNYTPYEIRIIGALVRLGRRDAALELLRFFLSDRRPPPWNQWPEIAWQDHQTPAHLGDLPHTWIAAEYVLAVRCLFAYEREQDQSLIIGAGLASEWLDADGVRVEKMPTLFGALSYSVRRLDASTLRFEFSGKVDARIVLRPPLAAPLREVIVDGAPIGNIFNADTVTLPRLPAEVICRT